MRAEADPTIRPAVAADRDALCALQLASWQGAYRGDLPDDYLDHRLPEVMAARWAARRFAPPELIFLTERDGQVDGFVCGLLDLDPPLIDNLHVRADRRGLGDGGRLLRTVQAALAHRGYEASYLTVLESNRRARAFYLAHGGRDEGGQWDLLVGHKVRVRRIAFDLQPPAWMG